MPFPDSPFRARRGSSGRETGNEERLRPWCAPHFTQGDFPMFRSRLHFCPTHRVRSRRRSVSLRLEVLEDRVSPAAFVVNTTDDTVAVNLTTGQDAAGHVSLRSAVQAANNLGGGNSISLPAGTYTFAIPGAGEDNAASGDLDIKNNLSLTGQGTAVVQANSLDRVFQVFAGFTATMTNVTVTGGRASSGGG